MLTRRLLAVGAACWALGSAASASATPALIATPLRIVAFRSIGGVRLGMSIPRVRDVLGRPTLVQYATGHRITEFGYSKRIGRYDESLFVFFGKFGGGGVTSIQDGLPARTAHGAGIGSSRATIRRAFGHLQCERIGCLATADHRTMSFAFDHGRVDLISFAPAVPTHQAPVSREAAALSSGRG